MPGTFQFVKYGLSSDPYGERQKPVGYVYSFTSDPSDGTISPEFIPFSGFVTSIELILSDAGTTITPVFTTKRGTTLDIGGSAKTSSAILLPNASTFIDVSEGIYVSFGAGDIGHGKTGFIIINVI